MFYNYVTHIRSFFSGLFKHATWPCFINIFLNDILIQAITGSCMKARPKGPRKRRQSQKNKAEIKPVTNVALQRYAKIVLIIGKTSFSTLFQKNTVRKKWMVTMKCGDEKFASKTSGSSAVPNISLRTIIKNLLLAVNMILLGMQFLLFFLGRWITKNGVRSPKSKCSWR